MTRHFAILMISAIILLSCSNNSGQSSQIDNLSKMVIVNPDSAYRILDGFLQAGNKCSKRTKMKYEILRAEAMNNAYLSMDSLADMQKIVEYYNFHGNNRERIMSQYLMGCVYRDNGDAPLALRYYREAVSKVDTTQPSCDYRLISSIYAQITSILIEQRSPILAYEAAKKAYHLALKANDTLRAINYLEMSAVPYHMLNNLDSALAISKTAIKMYEQNAYHTQAARAESMCIDVYLKKNMLHEADISIQKFEEGSMLFGKDGDIYPGHETYYAYKAQYFYAIGKSDSALYYYDKLIPIGNIDLKAEAYRGLVSVYTKLGRSDSVSKYALLLCLATDSMNISSSIKEINRNHALYNYSESQRIAIEKSKDAARYRNILWFSILAAILIIVVASYKINLWRKKTRLKLIKENERYTSFINKYKSSQSELILLKKDTEAYKKKKEKEIYELQKELSLFQDEGISPELWDMEQSLMSSKIVQRFHNLASKGKYPSSAEWDDFTHNVTSKMPDFYNVISDETKRLTEKEKRLCMLIRLRFIKSESAILLNVTSQRLTNIRAFVNAKLFHEKGAKTLDYNIEMVK